MRQLLFGLIAIATGCSGSDMTVVPRAMPVASVVFPSASSVSSLRVGASLQLTVMLLDANETLLANRSVSFTTSNATIAAVDDKGVVIGLAPGKVTIAAIAEGKRGEITLQVAVPEPCSPDLSAPCNRAEAYTLLLVDDQPLPVRSPYGAGEWDSDADAGTWRLTAALLLLYPDGTFANVVTHRAASGMTTSQSFGGSYARTSTSLLGFTEGRSTYPGAISGDRLVMSFSNGVTFTWKANPLSRGS